MPSFDHKKIEKKWQKEWERSKIYEVKDQPKAGRPRAGNFYTLIEFPYPSGNIHAGHWYAFPIPDIFARKKRMEGKNVLFPIGFDAFGLPAENAAIKRGINPKKWTYENIDYMRKQLRSMGASFDWSREVITADPEYYKWTQWIFLQFLKKGLAYQAVTAVNWCPKDKTVLANEQVVGGKCERCGSEVVQREMKQWMLKITDYAERLLSGLAKLNWKEEIKEAQRNWIGKSEGAEIEFEITGTPTYSGEVVFASNNQGKLKRMQKLFKAAGLAIKLKSPKEIGIKDFDVLEDGKTLAENSEKKARALAGKTKLSVLADDSGFFIDGAEIDPMMVKRNALNGKDEKSLSVEEIGALMLEYYKKIAAERGGKVDAEWRNSLCLVTSEKFAIHVEARRPVILTDKPHGAMDPSLPLRPLYMSRATGKYVLEQSEDEEMKELLPIIEGIKKLFTPSIKVFTTRPDTLFGATYLVFAPEHPFIAMGNEKSLFENKKEIDEYLKKAKSKTQLERQQGAKEKTGVELKGIKAINPANGEEIPVWVADYVLGGYGTGAIMAVPAHDERDFEFAKKFALPIRKVINPVLQHFLQNADSIASGAPASIAIEAECWEGAGELINSGSFDGMDSAKAKNEITKFVGGKIKTQYKLRDWVVSRQRYWGVPIPVIHCPKCGVQAVQDKDLPVVLPEIKDYLPTGEGKSPLAKAEKWLKVKCPECGGPAKRETDTLDTFVDSSWYFLRYCDPKNADAFADEAKIKAWMPVNLYSGGAEHTTMHLLYSRFWYKAMFDLGLIPKELGDEPYRERRNRGIILGPDGQKMSKSKGNVIDPDEYIKKFGSDTVRMYLAFIGPYGEVGSYPWDPHGILGIKRFLDRVWNLAEASAKKSLAKAQDLQDLAQRDGASRAIPQQRDMRVLANFGAETTESARLVRATNKTIKQVSENIEDFKFNTAISALMILLSDMEKGEGAKVDGVFSIFLKLLSPFAPHLTEEIWNKMRSKSAQGGPASGWKSIHLEKWPEFDPKLLEEDTFELIVQVNGKMRDKFEVPINISQAEAERLTLEREKVKLALDNKKPRKVIFVPKRLINFVV
ncbi:MAG: leucine--tRNA ligase [bacterium]|nr:leucine--tRNA ligase [bacterium]